MPLSGLSALLGLSGGAQGVAQGLNQWGAKRQQQDQMAQQLEIAKANFAAQMAGQGFMPVQPPSGRASIATPSASSGSHADMHAHAPATPPTPSVPEVQNEQYGYSPTLDIPEAAPQAPAVAPQPPVPAPMPQQQGSALASLIAPRQQPSISAFGQQYQRPEGYESPEDHRAKLAENFRIADEERKAKADSTKNANAMSLRRNALARKYPKMSPEELDGIASSETAFNQQMAPVQAPNLGVTTIGGTATEPGKVVAYDPKTGDIVKEVGDAKAASAGAGSAKMMQAVANNKATLSNIDRAIAAVQANPKAFGTENMHGLPVVGGWLDQRTDPGGVSVRAQVANIGSQKVHDRSGGAVTVSEFPRLAPFIPSISDRHQAIIDKLMQMKSVVEAENAAMAQAGVKSSGTQPPAGDPEFDALMAKYAKKP